MARPISAWGFRDRSRVPQLRFNDLSRLFALTGPVVMAVDQIDSVIAQSEQVDEDLLADRLADGLMRMREETTRTIIAVACIPKSWELIATRAVNSAADSFTVLDLSTAMPDAAVATAIVERHLAGLYGDIRFIPPYPTWPVLPMAFDDREVTNYTPRRLLQLVEEHVRRCLADDAVHELRHFMEVTEKIRPAPVVPDAADLVILDDQFARLRANADVVSPLDPQHEDGRMFALLDAALRCYVFEQGNDGQDLTIDPATIVKPTLHARLRRTLDEAREDEEHWSFRAIAHPNPRAVLTRLRSASLEAGLAPQAGKRHLVVLRNTAFSSGPVTTTAVAEFEAAHGVALTVSEDDLRTFSALEHMLADPPPGFLSWPDAPERDPLGGRDYTGTLITRAGTIHYRHDQAGRVVSRQQKRLSSKDWVWRYTWDAADRLTSVITPDGTHWRYRYDPLGRRIAKQRLAPDADAVLEQVEFTWGGDYLVEQAHNATQITTWDYAPGEHRPLAQHERTLHHDPGRAWFDERFCAIVTDLIGTPTELIDAQGGLARHAQATIWGTALTQTTSRASTPLRFPGQYFDPETGLHYNHHRYYDPTTGRYATPDPLGLAPAPNPHTYVDNPATWSDPLGLMGCETGDGGNSKEQQVGPYDSFEQARNKALDLLGKVDPATREPLIGRLPAATSTYGKVVGFRTYVEGVYKSFRLDFDPVKGPHINVTVGKGASALKWAVSWIGDEGGFGRILQGNT